MKLSLQPAGMDALSSVAPAPAKTVKSVSLDTDQYQLPLDIKAKSEALKKSVSDRMQVNFELEQDSMEGVDESEWGEQ